MEERMRDVDVVLEVRDSRAPLSCRCVAVKR
jgi:ribosome biogenesis GTPase A